MLIKIDEVKKYANESNSIWINTDHVVFVDRDHETIMLKDYGVIRTTLEDCVEVIKVMQGGEPSIVDSYKVIDGLEHCSSYGYDCMFCPYRDDDGEKEGTFCSDVLLADALKLIKGMEHGTEN